MHAAELAEILSSQRNVWVITGAGISAASGIPTYRDHGGQWKSATPIQHQEFVADANKRQRYWARSAVGWPTIADAEPNTSHQILAQMEKHNLIHYLVTQNVDGLHQKAGHQQVVDLHGRLDQAFCLNCGKYETRQSIQERLIAENPFLPEVNQQPAPDGDAHLSDEIISQVKAPLCTACGGILKPDVVFFGGTVPKPIVEDASSSLASASLMLVVGSSLTVYSGFRFCKIAEKLEIPIVAINQGATRADDLLSHKFSCDSGLLLQETYQLLNLNS
ncbi:NAD-dependent protein deacetylase [Aliikangiella marina]|uniref:protein acetyllysine N-acetyltransferase n=1 Tax=Aliikangiella marina TaxID=1712262 RepID=A0A545T4C4_9GAMM|nr:NAD-dependent protein deacetylase [Aliikangiella marina]TQV72077.1 NAD-dependent protein deacetylase [Aliikangiella marina]